MNFKNWLISEEIFPNKTATVYHRTKSLENIENILSKGYEISHQGGCHYGCGLYTTFDLKSQFNKYMERYGDYIIKFKVTNLENYLITPLNVAKYILGKDYKISDQLKKFNFLKGFKDVNLLGFWKTKFEKTFNLDNYDKLQETNPFTGEFLKELYRSNPKELEKLTGVVYRGEHDGYCLLKYSPIVDGTITMLSYAKANWSDLSSMEELIRNQGWKTSTDKEKISSLWQKDQRKRYVKIEDPSKNTILIKSARDNDLIKFKKAFHVLNKTSPIDKDHIFMIIQAAQDKIEVMRILGQESLNKLADDEIKTLILNANNQQEMSESLGRENINKLSNKSIELLMSLSSNKKEMAQILGIENINKLEGINVANLISSAKNKRDIAEVLGKENIDKLTPDDVVWLLGGKDKQEKAEIIGRENIKKLTGELIHELLKHFSPNKKEMIRILGPENMKKMSYRQRLDLGILLL